jgi:hypothetical protein
MTINRDALAKAESVTVAAIESGVPLLVAARELIASFQAMVRKKSLADLEPWLERARSSLVASFANGVVKRQGGGQRRDHLAMVERPDRGPDHQAQAREAPDVRPRKARSTSSPRHRRPAMPVDRAEIQNASLPTG